MKSVFFREGQHYSFHDLRKALGSSSDDALKKTINLLKQRSILKSVRKSSPEYSDLSDLDCVIGEVSDDSTEYTYQFTFVGIIYMDNAVIKCYPKYIDIDKEDFLREKFKTIIKVTEKYNRQEQSVHMYNGDAENKSFNRLAISLYILHDYLDNGLYSNQKEIIELNGDGEILWDKTINETFAYIKNNNPYYLDIYTSDNTDNDFDYIRRLHACIVTECSRFLERFDLLDLFDIPEAVVSEENIDSFGDKDYIRYRLEKEIGTQFVTRKQSLLKTLYTYVTEKSSNESGISLILYGTNAFNMIWEKACGEVLDNMYDSTWPVKRLAAEGYIDSRYINNGNKNRKINDYMENPIWSIAGKQVSNKGDLIPDIVTVRKHNGHTAMYILDGKYYLLRVNNENQLSGNPGVQDVVKQFIYNSALQGFVDNFHIEETANVFLIPAFASDQSIKTDFGSVSYWPVQRSCFREQPSVQVIKLNPDEVWKNYLENKKADDRIWDEIRTFPTKHYLYHNSEDDSQLVFSDSSEKLIVGYIRPDYFDFVADKPEFTFYFYASDDECRYPLHPYFDFCSGFIGYSDDNTKFIRGSIELLENGRCRIDELPASELKAVLAEEGFEKSGLNAVNYYKIRIKKSSVHMRPHDDIADFSTLMEKVNSNGLNHVLHRHSPKVIGL